MSLKSKDDKLPEIAKILDCSIDDLFTEMYREVQNTDKKIMNQS